MSKITTAERVSSDGSDNFVFQRSILAYHFAATKVGGKVLEIGTGSGYGVEVIAPHSTHFTTIDKFESATDFSLHPNVTFTKCNVPPLPFEDETFDCVISFQVIEHIEDDARFVAEVHRVLKKGGRFIVSTPNILMSLTRNPWHVREYTAQQFTALIASQFCEVKPYGVVGNEKIMEYYAKNREGVQRITRFDIFDLQHRLPRWMLQIPYDILNRINRRRLLSKNNTLTQSIRMSDYRVEELSDSAFDLLFVGVK